MGAVAPKKKISKNWQLPLLRETVVLSAIKVKISFLCSLLEGL